ncbi:hypothetical protein [Azotobacter chroococcum]|uniref:hypothetical protein n=1 Tax=Azotobacter chroococcum TaxID=353 RepID=UPI0010AE14E9|nr:hypothetical protein [Azotobacter chroococcum]TKD44230.1 hypothetical protein FCG41_07505 [Azotobacter chroococcum]
MNPIQMLKGWVTLTEAAAHITEKAGARVTEADILELAVDGKLRLSARFRGEGTEGAVAGTVAEPDPDSCFVDLVEEDPRPLLHLLNGVFGLRITTPPTVRVNAAGEIESLAFGLEFETAITGRVVRLPCRTLPASAQWVMRPDEMLEFCGKLTGEDREIETLRRMVEFDRSAKEAALLRAKQAEDDAAELRRQLEQERTARQAAKDKPSHLLVIAALMELLKAPVEHPRPQGRRQEAIKVDILDKFPWRGLSDRTLQKIFAAANKAKTDAE